MRHKSVRMMRCLWHGVTLVIDNIHSNYVKADSLAKYILARVFLLLNTTWDC
jgi:hypothetical protein